tara:strand:- start:85 stop:204 length:120 start_codon:yes stop_codon:yes gene_type:complete
MIVYLSGGMEYVINNGASGRIRFGDWLKNDIVHDVMNPV